ncbi:methyltransferase domain-containing protein [Helicobacter sp. 11S02596-1]|uniref:class I SAM-dependent methyltransferase n=1 Tax=Helicobacter sp. 11S02596-1 TaxID=1476194 RepID=UPI000BA54717|nr:methyltransferase domain-containing protein [Helicobacter sp. 11S02596-1]PAF42804.1 hypothetical protein BJI48_05990 [Helicobacter sp. 11S02596-1]
MKEDALKWDERHSGGFMPQTPSDFLVRFSDSLPQGRVLDIACGNGRNALFLAQKGFVCECVDISSVGLASLAGVAGVIPICVDLDDYAIKPCAYEVILDFYFLNRRLFGGIKAGLKRGGVFLMETFIADEAFPIDMGADKILQPGELEREFGDFEIFCKEERTAYRLEKEVKVITFGAKKPQ